MFTAIGLTYTKSSIDTFHVALKSRGCVLIFIIEETKSLRYLKYLKPYVSKLCRNFNNFSN